MLHTYVEHGDERPLQQPHQHVAPVVLVIGDARVAYVDGEGHQEELHGGPQESRPLGHQPGLHVQLREGGWGQQIGVSRPTAISYYEETNNEKSTHGF